MAMRIAGITDILHQLMEVDGVESAVVCGPEGLLIDGRGTGSRMDHIAAVGTQLLSISPRLNGAGHDHAPSVITSEWGDRTVLIATLDADLRLIVTLTRPGNALYVRHLVGKFAEHDAIA
jgi:predicted regulator of Ras-like GTPase activity (Roadblock/LC7/MglB family)